MLSYIGIWLLVSCPCIFASQLPFEEDFDFDQDIPRSETSSPLHRLWGISDTKARVGQLFHFSIPVDAFEGSISHYKVSTADGKPLPDWLQFNSKTGLLEGVPEEDSVGEVYILLQAIGENPQEMAKDLFAIEILPRPHILHVNAKERCKVGQEVSSLTVVIDRSLNEVSPKDKITTLKNLAGFLGISYEKINMISQAHDILSDAIIMAGPGNVKKKTASSTFVLQWQVGCGGKVFPAYKSQLQQIKLNSKDGTLAEVIQLPVIGWYLISEAPGPTFRHRREIVGSGDVENDLEEEIVNETEPEIEVEPETRIIPSLATPVFAEHMTSATPEVHRHRHHNGESPPLEVPTSLLTSPIPFASIMPTPIYVCTQSLWLLFFSLSLFL
uniref:Dystroglycan-type cadherin-like domain-containing protein n=1 Tax=Clastoptera arizonana TaxID=38151 RepID=A0A1B6DVV7_9HEMI